jgi:hypothetical protein
MPSLKRRQLLTHDPRRKAGAQIVKPCSDCPWARSSLAGWLGAADPDDWLLAVHGEARVECHVYADCQCAGAAIYRANMAKSVRSPELLRLPADRVLVFATPAEFLAHHAMPLRKATSR